MSWGHSELGFGRGVSLTLVAAATLGVASLTGAFGEDAPRKDAELDRTREQVKMLDDLYKTAIVAMTNTYVSKQGDKPAITVGQQIFEAMEKKGYHSAKLVDASGTPLNDDNAPRTDFEKAAAKAIRGGAPYFEQVVGTGSNRKLQAATVVPVVMKKCAECHTGKKVGEVIGFLRYELSVK